MQILERLEIVLEECYLTVKSKRKKVDSCSGGEKHRMMLSKIMLEQGNFLLLDEPTNHLDLEAIIALGEGLHQYAGSSYLCISR